VIPGIFFTLALAMQPDPAMLRRLFEEALAGRRQRFGEADARTAQAARDLGMFLERQGEADGAQAVLAQAVRIDEAVSGALAPQTLADVAELAGVSPTQQAESLWRRAAASTDAKVAARALTALGGIHASGGDRAGAAGFYRRALVKQEAATGHDSEAVAICLNALAQLVDVKEGIPLLERAAAIDRRAMGARHPQTASTEANLAGLLVNARRNDEAIRIASDALSIFQETLGPDHPRCAITASILAFALEAKGEPARAEKMYRLALAIDERAYGAQHPQTASDVRALAEFLRASGRPREAADLEKKAGAGR
jgi:tetratricopeptide (TPR) repeat protein